MITKRVTLRSERANRIYIAGPMTGIADFNFPAFNLAAERFRIRGYEVENPADHGVIEGADWADYLAFDVTCLGTCDNIYMLRGWENSKGAKLEFMIADRLGMKVMYEVEDQ